MKVIVIGLGSMGRRRIRLMKQYDSTLQITGIDSNEERAKHVAEEYGIYYALSIDDAMRGMSVMCAFVCTSPLSHYKIIQDLLIRGAHVFTEINLVSDGYERVIKLSEKEKRVLFLSSTFLYRKDIQYIMSQVYQRKVNYTYHTGQYLPDWHPWENYREFFVGNSRSNGCREILAIELPWILKCFGRIKRFEVLKDKMSSLDINYDDNYMLLLEHVNGTKGMIAVDVVARRAMRRLEIFNEELQIFWDGTPQSLNIFNLDTRELKHIETYVTIQRDKRYCDNIIDNAYMDEIVAFFEEVNHNDTKNKFHSFEKDWEIIQLIDQIENE